MEKVEYPFKTDDSKGWRFSQVTKGATSLYLQMWWYTHGLMMYVCNFPQKPSWQV